MEKPSFDLVRQILTSQRFRAQTTDQQQATLDEIVATGEITREEIFNLITEQAKKEYDAKVYGNVNNMIRGLEGLDYTTFVNVIMSGKIRGRDLLSLCTTSKKLNDYCNRSFQPTTRQGVPYGEKQDQYLFKILLDKAGVQPKNGETPKDAYLRMLNQEEILNKFDYYGIVSDAIGRREFRLVDKRRALAVQAMMTGQYVGTTTDAISTAKLLYYLWTVKVNIFVRVIVSRDGRNIYLFKLGSPNIDDIEMDTNGQPKMVTLNPLQPLPEVQDRSFDGIIHYQHIYPEILQWFFPSKAARTNAIDYPVDINPTEMQYENSRLLSTITQLSNIGAIKLLPRGLQGLIYGTNGSLLDQSLQFLLRSISAGALYRDKTIKGVYAEDTLIPAAQLPDPDNPGKFINSGVRFNQVWPHSKKHLSVILYLTYYLQGSIIFQ